MPPTRRSTRTTSSTAARDSAQPYTTRANRQASPGSSKPTASITRGANGSSLKLKVKAPSSKLKQVTGAADDGAFPPYPYGDASESDATPQPVTRQPRQTRNPRRVVEPDSDEDMEDAEGEEQDEDEDGMEEDEEEDDEEQSPEGDSEEDAEGEEDDEDELPSEPRIPPPVISVERPPGKSKLNVTVTAPTNGPLKSVEAKEMEDEDDDDDELSELDSNEDEEGGENDESDDDSDLDNSRSATPDLSKLTRRQRGALEEVPEENNLMELSNEAQKKKHLTAEEHAMRRAEMARRRKNLSEKRNEEEKVCFASFCFYHLFHGMSQLTLLAARDDRQTSQEARTQASNAR